MQLHHIKYPVNSNYFADEISLLDRDGRSIQRHQEHYLINALFGNTSIYSADWEGQKGKGYFQDYQGIAAGFVMYQNSQCRYQIKEVIWGIRGFQIFTGEQFIPTSLK